jgi:hypothetical protein
MSFVSRTTDPELRDQLAEYHAILAKARSLNSYLVRCGLEDLKEYDAALDEIDGSVVAIFENSEPMSLR